jgi:hypothetical protein
VGTDERAHLHVVARDHLPEALSRPLAGVSSAADAAGTVAK